MGPRFANRGYLRVQIARDVRIVASMGPRFANRGYQGPFLEGCLQLGASMGPRFANRGYRGGRANIWMWMLELQWVHGSRTVVIIRLRQKSDFSRPASMGPRFANRGYHTSGSDVPRSPSRFNGSTVREPWLSTSP